jgi:hypothetical protein
MHLVEPILPAQWVAQAAMILMETRTSIFFMVLAMLKQVMQHLPILRQMPQELPFLLAQLKAVQITLLIVVE